MASQHSTLSPERWAGFPLADQILMIGNEMNRAGKLFGPGNEERLENAYERVLNLTDLTVRVNARRSLRRELLRWRDLVAQLYLRGEPQAHRTAFRALLLLNPEAAKQIPFLLAER
jgi:hypothetical protein